MKKLMLVSLLVLAAISFSAYLNVAVLGDVRTMNPFLVKSSTERIVVGYLYETLLTQREGNLTGRLAESWEVDMDDNSITLKLAQRKFHDGTPVTADDVVFSFNYILQKRLPLGPILAFFTGAEKVDERTVKLRFRTMNISMFSFAPVAIPIIPKAIWEQIEKPLEFPNTTNPIGSGILKFSSMTLQSVTLDSNRDHPEAPKHIEGIIFHNVQDETMGFLGLAKGDYDYLYWDLDPMIVRQILGDSKKYPDVKIARTQGNSVYVLLFNHRKEPMNDVNFRKAIQAAIDYNSIINRVFMGFAEPASLGVIPPKARAVFDSEVGTVSQNLSKATELISKVKYDKKTLRLLVSTDKQANEIGEYIKQSLKNIGINVELDVQGPEGLTTKLKKADFDMALTAYALGTNPEMIYYHLHSSRGLIQNGQVVGFNYGGVNIAELDQLLDSIWMAFTDQERVEAFKKLQSFLKEVVPVVPICIPSNLEAYSTKNFDGWVVSEFEGVMNSQTLINLKPKR
ncbi:ABC transporter substrate-binding protein [Pseudothermotoga thermarum]|uniref:Extracellular solute-binding protein family 5 n=1 Tax=Pseudothermotoga thermarum DSM 5069 TaxID=688269 RepID=F7YWX2_9THEM|nr:ABC transporter substrate-binding protein [Pseudothermotoga thermarum]AEH50564.1 extracellular solute-binding protein family 5 [Pseudothermotoga thermarum DSM 5069]